MSVMAGRLRHNCGVLELDNELKPVNIGNIWASIVSKELADVPMQSGIRSAAKVSIRARYSDKLQQGTYLTNGDRLFQITSARDYLGTRSELNISADEFIGRKATYTPSGGAPVQCRVHLTHDAPYFDDFGKITSYRIKAEVILLEVGRPQAGDKIRIGSVDYIVTQYANDSDDAVVRGLWLDIA